MKRSVLENKRILAVDDETDILDTLEDLLSDYSGLILDKAKDYETAYQLMHSWTYDLITLDIMGVMGFDLLQAAVLLGIPAIMLTAHAMSPQSLKKSIELGARAFIPKDKMADIAEFMEDVLLFEHRSGLAKMLDRLGNYFSYRFGPEWQINEKDFWDEVAAGRYEPAILKKK
jgi:CheY-like chemotaxis protein